MTFYTRVKQFFTHIVIDMKDIRTYQKIILLLFGSLMIVFSIIDFNYFLNKKDNLLKWDNDKELGIEKWKRNLMMLSGVASFTGAFCVVLVSLGKLSSYFWGILNCIFYGIFAFSYEYVGDAQLNLFFYLPLQFVGIHQWINNIENNKNNTITTNKMKFKNYIISIIILGGCIPFFMWEIPAFSKLISGYYFYEDNKLAFWFDVLTNSLSVTAQYLLNNRHREQWILWIIINCMQIAMFADIGGFGVEFNAVAMWSFFLCNSLYGFYQWYFVHEKKCENSIVYDNPTFNL